MTDTIAQKQDLNALSFEEALQELESIVKILEQGQGKLDDAISAYERGMALRQYCDQKLREAEARIEKITQTPNGHIQTAPLTE